MDKLPQRPVIGVGTLNITPRARALVNQALDNNRLSYGPMTQEFEDRFARLHGCRFGVMSSSGTSALQIALGAMKELHGWQDDDEVVVPAVTFVSTVNIVFHNRMRPVLVDVDPAYYGMDPALIEAAITPRTRAIIPVHLFGQPCDMEPILEIAARHGLKVIEDSAETMFAGYRGRNVGGLGDIGCFSTYAAHLLTTGVGGLNTTNSPEYAVKLRSLMNHGRDSIYLSIDDDDDLSAEELRMIVERRFSFVSLGHSFRVTEMEAALGLGQLEGWEEMVQRRRENAAYLTRALSEYDNLLQFPQIREGNEHSFMMFPIVLRDQEKGAFVQFLEENGVETRDMLPLTNQPVHKRLLGIQEEDYPVADWINRNGFYVGCHQDLKTADLDYVVELFGRFFRQQQVQAREGSTLVLVAHNSVQVLDWVLDELPHEFFTEVLAVDLGSSDDTVDRLVRKGIRVLASEGRDALSFIFKQELERAQEHIVFFPLDGRQDVRDVARLLIALEKGCDMVTASRFIQGGARHDRDRRFAYRSTGNRVFTLLANLLFYGNCSDALSEFRAIKRSALKALAPDATGLGAMYQVSIRAMREGLRVEEIPTVEQARLTKQDRRRAWKSIFPLLRVLAMERRKG
ncbi:MAG: DegT/DnrJ/EryC1/StrS family aminotransferase [bacterium]|nr:DegT/DnrJ/EryC1/StrS family aminotransferase [bacterium]